jgi:hypothetical protein
MTERPDAAQPLQRYSANSWHPCRRFNHSKEGAFLMSAFKKCAGLLAGLSTVAVIGVAVAQSEPPNPLITNPAIGAGQQSTHETPMGETGVLASLPEVRTAATITREPEVAQVAPTPAPAAEPAPAPAPEPVAQAPAPAPEPPQTVAMGAAPEPQQPEPLQPRSDRN